MKEVNITAIRRGGPACPYWVKCLLALLLAFQLNQGVAAGSSANCSDAVIKSFKIIGKNRVNSPKGDKLFRLKLQGVISNPGIKPVSLRALIFALPQGARRKQLQSLKINNLKPGKSRVVSVLSPALSAAIEFLPQYSLGLRLVEKLPANCRVSPKDARHLKIIKRRQVLKALRHR